MCCSIVKISKDRKYIPKGRVREFEERAQRLKEQGIIAWARFDSALGVLEVMPKTFEEIGAPLNPAPFELVKFPNRTAYEWERVKLAQAFVALETELLELAQPRRRGRREEFEAEDYEIIIRALADATFADAQGASLKESRQVFNATLNKAIDETPFPPRGSDETPSRQVHRKRIRRRTPEVVQALKFLASQGHKSE
jgi:hypothetical protein